MKKDKEPEIQNPQRKDVTPKEPLTPEKLADLFKDIDPNQLQVLVGLLRATKRPLELAPTNTPKNLLEQFELFDDGVDQRVYFWLGGTWYYAALTT